MISEATHSHFLTFKREDWQRFREDTPMTLTEQDLEKLHGQLEQVSMAEVEEIYLPLSRLLNLYVKATRSLYNVTAKFLGHPEPRVPYIIGVSGSVAVGKSTTSRILKALLSRWPQHPKIEIVTTDGFLFDNKELEQRSMMDRKGFPESYDTAKLVHALRDLKAGLRNVKIPIYSHYHYDVLPDEFTIVDQPDIVIVEGLNVLQAQGDKTVFVSDFFDFSIYVDADIETIEQWFLERFWQFRQQAAGQEDGYFHMFATMSDDEALAYAKNVWQNINAQNLMDNIVPYMERAKLILKKNRNHLVEEVYLRKI